MICKIKRNAKLRNAKRQKEKNFCAGFPDRRGDTGGADPWPGRSWPGQ